MAERFTIDDFAAKLDLLLKSDRGDVRTTSRLVGRLGVHKDYLSRLRGGSRPVTEEILLKLCDIFEMSQRDWFDDLDTFGSRLGFSRRQSALITKRPLPGFDFASRIQDPRLVSSIFNVVSGYWASYYYSVSRLNRRWICRDLVVMRRLNEDGFIECSVCDPSFRYDGLCFPIKSHLYLMLEKAHLYNEIIVYAMTLPDRQPPSLFGIILCLSGGVDESHSYPCAAKVVFRYLGKTGDLRRHYGLAESEDVEAFLVREIPKYLDPEDADADPALKEVVGDISNVVGESRVPAALRMDK